MVFIETNGTHAADRIRHLSVSGWRFPASAARKTGPSGPTARIAIAIDSSGGKTWNS